MSLLEVIQLIGYATGALMTLWMGALLVRRRRSLTRTESVLLALAISIGLWHASNLVVVSHAVLGLDPGRWATLLRIVDTVAVVSITLSYSFLLHVHLHLWAGARSRPLTLSERARVYLSYIPPLFLLRAVPHLWTGEYRPMLDKLAGLALPAPGGASYVLAFSIWAAYVLGLVAITDLLIARQTSSNEERRSLRTIAASFIVIGLLILAVYGFGLGQGTALGLHLRTLANLGSLLPTTLIAYYIYRYRYLELIIRESLIVASFAVVVLAVYLYGIRFIAAWLTARYGLREGAVEALLILALALAAAPLRGWLERRFHELFEREASLYRDVVARIGARAGQYKQLPELLRFIEERTQRALGLRRVKIIKCVTGTDLPEPGELIGTTNPPLPEPDHAALADAILEVAGARAWSPVEEASVLRKSGYDIAYPLRREERTVGLMLVSASPDALTQDARAVLEVLAGQVAIAIEDCRLIEENVRLERRLAQRERLAALGQMAATVAHEVKNPLSAIKSIAQVMNEDESLRREYARDLGLIVGETDRLSNSVTQLLNFAKSTPPVLLPSRADELTRAVVDLFRADARERGVSLDLRAAAQGELDGACTAAVRDALSNLIINALQATPPGGRVSVEASANGDGLTIAVTDSGTGVKDELRERIWEPFFTTRQRGTGLGLAIVRRRIEEVGGTTRLAKSRAGEGTRFELDVPLSAGRKLNSK